MTDSPGPEVGTITWMDLTVPEATAIRDFYQKVVGWSPAEVSMGDYDDFNMNLPATGQTVAGICHARGGNNAQLPAQWLIYITVENLDESMDRCREHGGEIIAGPVSGGASGRFCVIRDPAGAAAALFQPAL